MAVVDAINLIGIDNVVRIIVEGYDAISQAVEWIIEKAQVIYDSVKKWINDIFKKGDVSSTGDPNNWNKRDYYLDQVSNKELRNAIDQLYRKGAEIGDGGTADMLRYEFIMGWS